MQNAYRMPQNKKQSLSNIPKECWQLLNKGRTLKSAALI